MRKICRLMVLSAFEGKVVLVHGDSHYFKYDKAMYNENGTLTGNFTRIEVFGNADNSWVEMTVNPSSENVFFLCAGSSQLTCCFYRFVPDNLLGGRGSLHAAGQLAAMAVAGLGTDLSIVQNAGMVLKVGWINMPNPNPADDEPSVREQPLL
jgi:hypothetical protein